MAPKGYNYIRTDVKWARTGIIFVRVIFHFNNGMKRVWQIFRFLLGGAVYLVLCIAAILSWPIVKICELWEKLIG